MTHGTGSGLDTHRAHPGTVCVVNETNPQTRKLVKARLLPDLAAELHDYAQAAGRTDSNAAEHLIRLGLAAERAQATPATPTPGRGLAGALPADQRPVHHR